MLLGAFFEARKQVMAKAAKLSRREILGQAAQESTAHGLARVASDRHWTVRLLWCLAFLAVVCLLLVQLFEALQRLLRKPVTTSVTPNAEDFVFPDIHICSYPMISASYSASMTPEALNYTRWQADRISRLLSAIGISGNELSRLTAQALVSTLPYAFLSSNMGMRMEQNIIGATVMPVTQNLKLNADIVNLRHYKFLNCYTIRLNDSISQSLLSNVMGYLDLSLYADATYNTTLRLSNGTIDVRGLSFVSYEYMIGSGFRLYFTDRGEYPDEYTSSVALSPGFHHYISLSMTVGSLAIEKEQCAKDMPSVPIFDPVMQLPVEYAYSLGSCYARSLSKLFQKQDLQCYIPGYSPILYADRDIRACSNLNELLDTYESVGLTPKVVSMLRFFQAIFNGSVADRMVTTVENMQRDCRYAKPCFQRAYKPSVTSVLFPLRQGLTTELTSIFLRLTKQLTNANYSVPGREWMVQLFHAANKASSSQTDEDALATAASENIIRVHIQTGELSSTLFTQVISYSLDDLTAGIGGLMGLFMGGSVLTLMELVELCVCLALGRRLTTTEKEATAVGVADGVESDQRSPSYGSSTQSGALGVGISDKTVL